MNRLKGLRPVQMIAALVALLLLHDCHAGESGPDALLARTTRGGLCLYLGASAPDVPVALAAAGNFYIQVLQAEPKAAQAWGGTFAASDRREQLGVRNAPFQPGDYGSDLFNLIVIDDPAALNGAKAADLFRILTPAGCAAFRALPDGFASAAKALGVESFEAAGYKLFRKPITPVEWKPCNSVKWRAGPRAQLSSGWSSVTADDGKFFYRERMEIPGTLDRSRSQLFARDAYNGRLLWTLAEDGDWAGRPLAAARGRVFTTLGDKLVCMDDVTGKHLFDLVPSGLKGRSVLSLDISGEFLLSSGEYGYHVYGIEDGKELAKLGGVYASTHRDGILYTHNRSALEARSLKDTSKILWSAKGDAASLGELRTSEKYVYIVRGGPNYKGPDITAVNRQTGEVLWSHTIERVKGRSYWNENFGDNLYVVSYSPYENKAQDMWVSRLDPATGKVLGEDIGPKGADPFNMCAPVFHKAGKYLVYFFGVWVDFDSNQRKLEYLAHPSCFFGTIFENGLMYNIPSRKAGALQGISAMGPADLAFDQEPGGKVLKKFAPAVPGPDAREDDWPMFRGNPARGNASAANPGEKLTKSWEATVSLGGRSFGVMSGERTGLTQPVCANGLVIVSDIDAQRIVAFDATAGKQRWIFPVGSRVDFPPTLHKGLCLFAAKDGWAYALNASDGTLAYKLLIAPRERLIGGQEKLESLWPMAADVFVANGVAFASVGLGFDHLGGVRAVAFKPETGEVVWSQTYYDEKHAGYGPGMTAGMFSLGASKAGPALSLNGMAIDLANGKLLNRQGGVGGTLRGGSMDDYMGGGPSIPRNGEDRSGVGLSDDRLWGKTIAFDKDLSVGYAAGGGPETWEYKGAIKLYARNAPGKTNLWEKPDNEITADDLVLTPQYVYCVGHYARVVKEPELLVLSRADGKVLQTIPVGGYPAYNGMSAAGKRLFVATREGKLICFESK